MNNGEINQDDKFEMPSEDSQNLPVEEIPDELFAPIGNQTFQRPTEKEEKEFIHPIDQPVNLDDEKMSLEEEARAVRKYELGERGYNPKLKKHIIIVSILFFICVIGLYYFYNSPKVVFSRGVTKCYKKVNESVFDISSSSPFTMTQKNIITNEIGISFQSTIERGYNNKSIKDALEALKNFSIKGKIQTSRKDKKIVGNVNIKSGIYKALDLSFAGEKDNVIAQVSNTSLNPFSISWKGYSSLFNEQEETSIQFKDVTEKIKKQFQSFIKNKKIASGKERISIYDKKVDLKKLTIMLTKEEINQFMNILLSDQSLFESLEKITGFSKSTLKSKIQNYFNQIDVTNGVNISIYVHGFWNEAIGWELQTLKDHSGLFQIIEDQSSQKILWQNSKQIIFDYESNKNKGKVEIQGFEFLFEKIKISTSKKSYKYSLYKDKKELFHGNINFTKNDTKSKKDGLITFDMSLKEEDIPVVNARMDISYSTYIEERIRSLQWKNVLPYEKLKKEEQEKIINRFMKNPYIREIENKIKNISNMEVIDRNTTRYTYSYVDNINRLLKEQKEKKPDFHLQGTYLLSKNGFLQGEKIVFPFDQEKILFHPDLTFLQNQMTIYNNQVVSAKLKFENYYVLYNSQNQEQPIFITKKSFSN